MQLIAKIQMVTPNRRAPTSLIMYYLSSTQHTHHHRFVSFTFFILSLVAVIELKKNNQGPEKYRGPKKKKTAHPNSFIKKNVKKNEREKSGLAGSNGE